MPKGVDAASIPAVEPVYQWPYRPEMQFSLFDLQLQGRDRINARPTINRLKDLSFAKTKNRN